ncbi:MAG: hypothetical protein NT138_08750 [Planctomycetales bacterium]|nr:hypothetical protein [Planctomycetales bacterium]
MSTAQEFLTQPGLAPAEIPESWRNGIAKGACLGFAGASQHIFVTHINRLVMSLRYKHNKDAKLDAHSRQLVIAFIGFNAFNFALTGCC